MRALFIVLSATDRQDWAQSIANAAGTSSVEFFVGAPAQAAQHLATHQLSPSHIVLDIGDQGLDILADVDLLAQQCEPGTRVVTVGNTNDVQLYRGLLARGVIDYLPMPVAATEVAQALRSPAVAPAAPAAAPLATSTPGNEKRVISFLSAASGDGASMTALNVAYNFSQFFNGSTVLVDMDYQYGMMAKHLALQNQYGIRDLFDHPERGVDATLIRRMVANYGKLHVITAPSELRYLPSVSAEAVRELITTLKQTYDNVIIDLPHVWLPWVNTVTAESTHLVLVAQLWLKSVSHAARMMRAFRENQLPLDRLYPVINRSGAKFKEAIDVRDFERVCNSTVKYTLANDIKTVVAAEVAAKTVMEIDQSPLANDLMRLSRALAGLPAEAASPISVRGASGLFAKFGK